MRQNERLQPNGSLDPLILEFQLKGLELPGSRFASRERIPRREGVAIQDDSQLFPADLTGKEAVKYHRQVQLELAAHRHELLPRRLGIRIPDNTIDAFPKYDCSGRLRERRAQNL